MNLSLDITVSLASLVLVSQSPIDRQSVTPAMLKDGQVIPEHWVLSNTIDTPSVAGGEYENGVTVRSEGNRCVFQQRVDGPFRDVYEIHNIAKQYANAMRLVPYQAVGINWQLIIESDDPFRWLHQRMTNSEGIMSDFVPVSIRVAKPWHTGTCNLTFNVENRRIVLDCNYHVGLTSCSLHDAISSWGKCQKHLQEEILPRFR